MSNKPDMWLHVVRLEKPEKSGAELYVVCPNGCGDLTMLKKRPPMLHLIHEDLLEYVTDEENDYGYLAGVCTECGFVLIVEAVV